MEKPVFPRFKALELDDRPALQDLFWRYQPETSELTFTNLFIWRRRYGFHWSTLKDWLLVVSMPEGAEPVGFPPLGPGTRAEAVRSVFRWLAEEHAAAAPRIERADSRLAAELSTSGEFVIEPDRPQFDYSYRTADLIDLAGSRYHGKRNHIARLHERHAVTYAPLEASHIIPCLNLAETWCTYKRCEEDMGLMDEWDAVKECLAHFQVLNVKGGVLLIEGRVEAFTLGERLNEKTAVVHIEKANPDIPGLYTAVNREFCRNEWSAVPFINREQDLGEEGLRKAKLSYHPLRFVEKFTVRAAGR
jgi:hypothetical protein